MEEEIKQILFCVILALCAFQSGFIYKCWWDYKHGPVPIITPSEISNAMGVLK